jgi:hypothetical protein
MRLVFMYGEASISDPKVEQPAPIIAGLVIPLADGK